MKKLLKGSLIIFIGAIIFRDRGGYLYRVLMQYFLGVDGYGILSLVISLQWILILIAVAGLPPAIAKYVSQYLAKEDKYMAEDCYLNVVKIMLFMSLVLMVMFYLLARPIAYIYMRDLKW